MPKLYLKCKDKRYGKGEWLLRLRRDEVTLEDPDGEEFAVFSHAEAQARFVLPSFWESVKGLGVRADDKTLIWFVPEREDVAEIKSYLDSALATQGPKAIAAVKLRGWLLVLGGLGLSAVCFLLGVLGFLDAINNQRNRYTIVAGGAVGGLVVVARGIKDLLKAARAEEIDDG